MKIRIVRIVLFYGMCEVSSLHV